MATTRRDFLHATALGAGALGIPDLAGAFEPREPREPREASAPRAEQARPARHPLNLLILGGTGFIGPHQVRYAIQRGHKVTVFNRGKREADLPAAVIHLQGDRNDDLKSLEGGKWDVVIDNPTTLPNWVRLSGRLLKDACRQYIFISTISVYADTSKPGMDETTPVLAYEGKTDPFELKPEDARSFYGQLKALSEREAAHWFPGRATIIRPGLIVGPGDETDRFTYWPARIDRGGEVLAPGSPSDPTQIIDARDLAEWTIRAAEDETVGVFNATGPEEPRPIGEMLNGIKTAIGSKATFAWASPEFLESQKVSGWSDMPVWVPPSGENAGFSRVSVKRALAKGLTYRPFAVTARDTLAYHKSRPEERRNKLRAGLTAEREAEVLAALKASKSSK
jgi:2'-hydroxyisoflavone reductase